MTQQLIPLCRYNTNNANNSWAISMAEMVKAYIRGEKIFVQFDGKTDTRRTGAIGRLVISETCMQNYLHGSYHHRAWGYNNNVPPRDRIEPDESKITPQAMITIALDAHVEFDGRKNRVGVTNGWGADWIKGYDESKGTVWKWAKPDDPPQVIPEDKLGREIKKGDFISYVLYHFDNDRNAAGIYYGKVTKIEADGTVHAKNIKLSEDDRVAEKKIKDNSLIVIMSKDLMDKLMLARLAIL